MGEITISIPLSAVIREKMEVNNATYQALIELVSYLCLKYDLTKEQVIRHYDVTGKLCPLYFVKHEGEWNQLKDKIEKNCQTISKS